MCIERQEGNSHRNHLPAALPLCVFSLFASLLTILSKKASVNLSLSLVQDKNYYSAMSCLKRHCISAWMLSFFCGFFDVWEWEVARELERQWKGFGSNSRGTSSCTTVLQVKDLLDFHQGSGQNNPVLNGRSVCCFFSVPPTQFISRNSLRKNKLFLSFGQHGDKNKKKKPLMVFITTLINLMFKSQLNLSLVNYFFYVWLIPVQHLHIYLSATHNASGS